VVLPNIGSCKVFVFYEEWQWQQISYWILYAVVVSDILNFEF
jgi:hypothetical protein